MAKSPQTQYAILGALTVFPMSGYDIKKWITDVTGSFWAESSGRIYPTLKELLQQKLIKCDATKGRGKRPRKLYEITPRGLKILQKWLAMPARPLVLRNELRLKLFYGKNLPSKIIIQHLKRQQERMAKELVRYQEIKEHIKSNHQNQIDSGYWLLTLKSAIHHAKAELNWCREILKAGF